MANSIYPQPKTLADFKRWLATENATLTIQEYKVVDPETRVLRRLTHKFEGIPRKVAKLQTESFQLETADGQVSWMTFGKAGEWTFDLGKASCDTEWMTLVYELHN